MIAAEPLGIAAWAEGLEPDIVAGSVYSLPPALRLQAARLLAHRGHRVHADLIVDGSGQHVGIRPAELDALRGACLQAPLDVHLMLPAPPLSPAQRKAAEEAISKARKAGAASLTIPVHALNSSSRGLQELRAGGTPVWVEVPPQMRGLQDGDRADGALVMLIPPGTRQAAEPAHLSKVRALSTSMPVGVDGGVTADLAVEARAAGAAILVSGRALFILQTEKGRELSTNTVPDTMRASVLLGKKNLVIEDRETPAYGEDEVLVKIAAVGVCGSDVHYFRHGRIGDFVVESPLILGHEVSGRIVAVGEKVAPARIGQRVAIEPQRPCGRCRECRSGAYNLCPNMEFYATPPIDGAFAEYAVIQDAFAHTIPDSLSDEAAALLEPLSVAITTMRKARVAPGTSILIAGAGPIGIICAQTARAFGAAEIIVTDLVSERRQRALEFGATKVIDPAETDVATAGLDVNAFVDASGAPRAVFSGIKAVRPGGHAVLVGLGNPEMSLPIEHIQNYEINVTGIFRYTDTWPAAIHLVASGMVDLDSLVTGRFGLDQVREALESDQDPESLKSVVYPSK